AHCGSCTTVCSGSTPNCVGGICSGTSCPGGTSDCNASSGDGCECSTPGCCGTGCQTTHNDGVGHNFYDCVALGTSNPTQALEACAAYTGNASMCHAFSCKPPGQNAVVCSDAFSGSCVCWNYSGGNVGHVFNSGASGVSNCYCPISTDPTWN